MTMQDYEQPIEKVPVDQESLAGRRPTPLPDEETAGVNTSEDKGVDEFHPDTLRPGAVGEPGSNAGEVDPGIGNGGLDPDVEFAGE